MGKTLRELREERGLTQEDMAKELGYSSKSGYNHLENGNVGIKIEQAKKIADLFGVKVDDIFFGTKVEETQTNIIK